MKKTYLLLLLLFALLSCEKQSDHAIKSENLDLLVVDGILTDEHKPQTIRLTRTVSELNAPPQAVSQATVILSEPNSTTFLHEQPTNPGVYQIQGPFVVHPNVEYSLLITANGKTYSAKTFMVPPGPLKMLRFVKNNDERLYHIQWIVNPYDGINPAMFEITLDWSKVAGYTALPAEQCQAKMYYYTLPTIDVSQIFAPELEQIRFPLGTKIVEKRYSLNPEYTEFVRALLLETTWKGGLFDSAPANVPTNLSQGAVGFFSACSVVRDSLIVQ